MSRYFDPDEDGVHPLRHELSDDDWDRLDRFFVDKDETVEVSMEELAAYEDYIFDCICCEKQNTLGVTTLQ